MWCGTGNSYISAIAVEYCIYAPEMYVFLLFTFSLPLIFLPFQWF
jgi:hypothetical protein